jgi:hypothetical protein
MDLKIISIHEQGKQDAEYIKLQATADCNLKYYMVCDTTYSSPTTISNKLRHQYWFASKEIKKDDYIFLRTGSGTNRSFANNANSTTHEFFWGLKEPIWNNTGDAGILFALEGWQTHKA